VVPKLWEEPVSTIAEKMMAEYARYADNYMADHPGVTRAQAEEAVSLWAVMVTADPS
jgi:hypothetical protein